MRVHPRSERRAANPSNNQLANQPAVSIQFKCYQSLNASDLNVFLFFCCCHSRRTLYQTAWVQLLRFIGTTAPADTLSSPMSVTQVMEAFGAPPGELGTPVEAEAGADYAANNTAGKAVLPKVNASTPAKAGIAARASPVTVAAAAAQEAAAVEAATAAAVAAAAAVPEHSAADPLHFPVTFTEDSLRTMLVKPLRELCERHKLLRPSDKRVLKTEMVQLLRAFLYASQR